MSESAVALCTLAGNPFGRSDIDEEDHIFHLGAGDFASVLFSVIGGSRASESGREFTVLTSEGSEKIPVLASEEVILENGLGLGARELSMPREVPVEDRSQARDTGEGMQRPGEAVEKKAAVTPQPKRMRDQDALAPSQEKPSAVESHVARALAEGDLIARPLSPRAVESERAVGPEIAVQSESRADVPRFSQPVHDRVSVGEEPQFPHRVEFDFLMGRDSGTPRSNRSEHIKEPENLAVRDHPESTSSKNPGDIELPAIPREGSTRLTVSDVSDSLFPVRESIVLDREPGFLVHENRVPYETEAIDRDPLPLKAGEAVWIKAEEAQGSSGKSDRLVSLDGKSLSHIGVVKLDHEVDTDDEASSGRRPSPEDPSHSVTVQAGRAVMGRGIDSRGETRRTHLTPAEYDVSIPGEKAHPWSNSSNVVQVGIERGSDEPAALEPRDGESLRWEGGSPEWARPGSTSPHHDRSDPEIQSLKPIAGAFTGIAPHDPVVGEGNLLTRMRVAHQPADLMQAVEEETVRYLESARESSDEYLASIRLHPPELGGVAMKLRVKDQKIELRLGVESEDIRCLIETNLSTLRTALNDRGYSLTQCDVFVSGDRHGGTDPNVPWSGGEHVQVTQASAVIHSKGQARVNTLTENRVNVLV